MCVCNARTSVLGAPGCARDQEQDGAELKQELAHRRRAWRPRRSSGRGSATWGTQGRDSTRSGGRRQGLGVTRGIAGKQEVAPGRQWATWRGKKKPARGRGAAGQVLGRHVACLRVALERGSARHMAGRATAARGRETEERGREVDEGGLDCYFQKGQGPYCNAQITFKPELK
jgi:hypothetical protein